MKYLFILNMVLLTSCQTLPQLYQAAAEIADDKAIKVEISKETFQKETDVAINITVQNKDQPITQTAPTPIVSK